MDFHRLTRRQLQTLCKKNKIPANITNIAMADALQVLDTVQGIEELLLIPLESSIRSPSKSEVTSLSVTRTGGATTTLRKTVKDESETLQALTGSRRSTRTLVPGDCDLGYNSVAQTPAAAIGNRGRKALAASACRKMETQIGKEKANISETPGMVPDSRQRVLKGETTLRNVYTRRSARLAGKNVKDLNIKEKDISETVNTNLFSISNGFGEECSADVETVTEGSVAGIELKEKSAQELDGSKNIEEVSGSKSDCSTENPNNSQVGFDEDTGDHVEIVESKMTVANDGGEGDTSNNESSDGYTSKLKDALENGQELDSDEEIGSNDATAEDVDQVIDHTEDEFSIDNGTDCKTWKEELESNKHLDGFHDMNAFEDGKELNDESPDVEKDGGTEDSDDLSINDGMVENNESSDYELFPRNEEQDTGIFPGVDLIVETSNSSEEEAFANDLTEMSSAMELNTSAAHQDMINACLESKICWVEGEGKLREKISDDNAEGGPDDSVTLKQLGKDELVECEPKSKEENLTPLFATANVTGDVSVLSCLITDSNDDISSVRGGTDLTRHTVVPTSLTPVKGAPTPRKTPLKKSVSKTPTAAKRMITQVLDDNKENIDNSGTILFLTKEKEKTDTCEHNSQKPYFEQSLRELKKILKGKLELTKKMDNNEEINTKVVTTRPALQALPENRFVGDS